MDDDMAERIRKAQEEWKAAQEKVKASGQYGWFKDQSSAFRFVVGAALAIVLVVSLVSWLT